MSHKSAKHDALIRLIRQSKSTASTAYEHPRNFAGVIISANPIIEQSVFASQVHNTLQIPTPVVAFGWAASQASHPSRVLRM
jgi:hypothetical protein